MLTANRSRASGFLVLLALLVSGKVLASEGVVTGGGGACVAQAPRPVVAYTCNVLIRQYTNKGMVYSTRSAVEVKHTPVTLVPADFTSKLVDSSGNAKVIAPDYFGGENRGVTIDVRPTEYPNCKWENVSIETTARVLIDGQDMRVRVRGTGKITATGVSENFELEARDRMTFNVDCVRTDLYRPKQ